MNLKKIIATAFSTLLLFGCAKIGEDQAQEIAKKFIDENLLGGGMTAEIVEIESESGWWKLKVRLSDEREVDAFLSSDGKIFAPQAIYIAEAEEEAEKLKTEATESKTASLAEIEKSDKPVVELFIMSHCPFGTQAEKAILPAVEKLGDSIDFQLKFVNYAMHGKTEVDEQLRQFAISEKYPEKLIPYLKEFLAAGESEAALAAVDLTKDDLTEIVTTTDEEFEITKNLEDESLWMSAKYPHFNIHNAENEKYEVRGSPTLVVNGKTIESVERNAADMLTTICAAFNTPVEACGAELSKKSPAAGFGYDGEGEDGGSCE